MKQRQAQEEAMSSSDSERGQTRTYAAVVAQPGTTDTGTTVPPPGPIGPPGPSGPAATGPPGPATTGPPGRSPSPPPVASGSGLQPKVARTSKMRKREVAVVLDTDEEDTSLDPEAIMRANRMMKIEMANLSSRAVMLQQNLGDYAQGLEESTNLLDMAKKREEALVTKHAEELRVAARQLEEHTDRENTRVLVEYRQQARYANGANNYWGSCLEFISMIFSNAIHA